jgi:enterochelin esterase-like enzyme
MKSWTTIQRIAVAIAVAMCFTFLSFSQGKVIESKTMDSKILSKQVKYSIYLPPDYDISARSYPVLYLLHGYSDNETAWVQFGEVNSTADKLISQQEAPAMIIVMPDAGVTWYINDYLGKTRYEDMFFNEFIPYIEKTYRIRTSKEFRAVGGLSMGGYGALGYSMRHPEIFSSCIALSSGVHTNDEALERFKNIKYNFTDVYGPLAGDSLPAYWKLYNILDIASTFPKETLESVKYYIDCGDKDFLIASNCELHLILKKRGIAHEFRVREGEHNWTYWRVGIADGMKFIGKSFHR